MTQHPPHPRLNPIVFAKAIIAIANAEPEQCAHECCCIDHIDKVRKGEDYEYCSYEECPNDTRIHTTPASHQRIEQVLNTLIARFMLANEKGQGRPWNIHHIVSLIETFRDTEAIALLREGDNK